MIVKFESPEIIARNIKEWDISIPEQEYMVVIHCSTYNHGKYIEDALKGFVMQQTNFPFCAIIIDDASTDNNTEIIKKYAKQYPNIIKPICLGYNHMQNGLSRNPYFDCWHKSAKYIAQCEGDDYWIDPTKLQKQIDFLEANPDYMMCFHKASIINEINFGTGLKCEDIENKDYDANELFCNWIVPTASMVYRKEVNKVTYKNRSKVLNGDIVTILTCATLGKIRGFNDTMSAYRIQSNGVTYDKKLNKTRIFKYPDHFLFIKENFPIIKKEYINRYISEAYLGRIFVQDTVSNKIKDLVLSFYYHPSFATKGVLRYIIDKLKLNGAKKKRMD